MFGSVGDAEGVVKDEVDEGVFASVCEGDGAEGIVVSVVFKEVVELGGMCGVNVGMTVGLVMVGDGKVDDLVNSLLGQWERTLVQVYQDCGDGQKLCSL
nr:hypothetical protein [Tanacetum cinerariifolium]